LLLQLPPELLGKLQWSQQNRNDKSGKSSMVGDADCVAASKTIAKGGSSKPLPSTDSRSLASQQVMPGGMCIVVVAAPTNQEVTANRYYYIIMNPDFS
jgi:hypothetical protein